MLDIVLIIEQLYENNKEDHQLSNQDNKNKWTNLLNLLQSIQDSSDQSQIQKQKTDQEQEIKQRILQNSNMFLLCQCKEQEDYLLYLQIKLQQRGLQLKQDLTDQQMIETGLGYAIILLLENQLNPEVKKEENQNTSSFKSIHKVLNYDYFIENNGNDNLQRYEEISCSENSFKNEKQKKQEEEIDTLQKYLYPAKNNENNTSPCSQSPLRIQISSKQSSSKQKKYTFSQNLYKNSQVSHKNKCIQSDLNRNLQSNNIFRGEHIFNLSILFYRFFESFEKSYEQYSVIQSPCLSHYFLNIISQQNQQIIINKQNQNLKSNESKILSSQQKCFTPLKISTPDAIRQIENNFTMISNNKETTQDNNKDTMQKSNKENPYTTCFQTSIVQQFDPINNLFETKLKNQKYGVRHSVDHTGDKIVDSPSQYKRNNKQKKNERHESCILNGNIFFEDSQLIINQLDLEKRRYQQYCQEQSQQIKELNSLYIDLKNKYESLLQSTLEDYIHNPETQDTNHFQNNQKPRKSQDSQIIKENKKQKNGGQRYSKQQIESSSEDQQENKLKQQKQEQQQFFNFKQQQQKGQEQIFESEIIETSTFCLSNQNNLKTSECNPIMFQTLPNKNLIFIENDSDLNRRQVHNDILSQSILFQSASQQLNNESPFKVDNEDLDQQAPLFNYVTISDIWKNKIMSSFQSNKSRNQEQSKTQISKQDIFKLIFSFFVFIALFWLILFY